MKEIVKVFRDENIRVCIKDGEPFFSILDVSKVLDISNSRDVTSRLNKDDVVITDVIDNMGRDQKLTMINEGALYQVIFRSKKKEAKDFQRWVTHEVLPSIRKTGKYSIPENIKQISTKNRNGLTSEWQAHGITKPHEYIRLTLQEYKALDIKNKKKEMTKLEMLRLNALESMEMLKLFQNQDINGYHKCKDSLIDTAKKIPDNILNTPKIKELK